MVAERARVAGDGRPEGGYPAWAARGGRLLPENVTERLPRKKRPSGGRGEGRGGMVRGCLGIILLGPARGQRHEDQTSR